MLCLSVCLLVCLCVSCVFCLRTTAFIWHPHFSARACYCSVRTVVPGGLRAWTGAGAVATGVAEEAYIAKKTTDKPSYGIEPPIRQRTFDSVEGRRMVTDYSLDAEKNRSARPRSG